MPMRVSIRASGMPRQKCTPSPNARFRALSRSSTSSSARAYSRGSRLAEANRTSTREPVGSSWPCMVTGRVVTRASHCAGASNRRNSSMAGARNCPASSRSAFAATSSVATAWAMLPMRLEVVSIPAAMSSRVRPWISLSFIRPASMPVAMSLKTSSVMPSTRRRRTWSTK